MIVVYVACAAPILGQRVKGGNTTEGWGRGFRYSWIQRVPCGGFGALIGVSVLNFESGQRLVEKPTILIPGEGAPL